MTDDRAIGIFDSGLGGLTVLKAIREKLPNEDIVYFGDTARLPYGSKSTKTIIKYSLNNANFLSRYTHLKLLVIACNTATAAALPALRDALPIPVIGVIDPAVKMALEQGDSKPIGVLATVSTVNSGAYEKAFVKLGFRGQVIARSCPLFVPLVEEGLVAGNIPYLIAERYLRQVPSTIETIILGCTHYPFLLKVLRALRKDVRFITSSEAVAHEVKILLEGGQALSSRTSNGRIKFLVTDSPNGLSQFYERYCEHGHLSKGQVELVEL